MVRVFLLILLIVSFKIDLVKGQTPTAQFTVNNLGCLNEQMVLNNQSVNASSFIWDFCFQDLNFVKDVQNIATANGAATPTGISFFNQNNNWFGFVSSRDNNKLFRLDFGASLENTPTIVDLGNVGNLLNGPENLVLFEQGNIVYGVLSNYVGGNLLRLSFNSGLNALPVAEDLTGFGMTNPRGVDLVKDQTNNIIVAVADDGGSAVLLINFGNSILNNPSLSSVTSLSVGAGLRPIGIKLMNDGNNWFGFVSLYAGNSIRRIDFGSSISSTVTLTDIFSVTNPTGLAFQKEGNSNQLFVASLSGNIYQLENPNLSSSQMVSTALGRFGILSNTFGFTVVRSTPIWYGFAIDYISNEISRIKFQGDCSNAISINNSNQFTPPIQYKSAGDYYLELTAYSVTSQDVISKQTTIQNQVAPAVSITNDNSCVNSIVSFQAIESSGLTLNTWQWNFDDGNNSTLAAPSNHFTSIGQYNITLDVTASNTCSNRAARILQIYNPPQANFILPSIMPICSNQNYLFTNTSTSDNGSNPTWQWSVNGNNVATTQDLNYLIPSAVAQNITLTASIPGCSSQSIQSIVTVQDGPLANFSSPNTGCVGTSIPFTNTTSGAVTSYAWTFGDGNISSQTNATNTYSSSGTFAVTLTAYNAAGCQNFLSKDISVYSNPQPDFAVEAPPYSCANYPAQFDNNTPPLPDSNIATWVWNFGDAANGTSNQKNPSYTFSTATTYNVTLQAISNFGCTGTKQHNVVIYPSPQSAFTNSPACVNQNTQFTDASSGNITSYQWVIQGIILSGANPPSYVFKSAGTFPVSLTTTSSNGCKNQVVKNISIPVPPVMDFTSQPPCTGKPTTFQEANPGGSDPSVAWNWNFGSGSGTGSPTDHTFIAAGVYSVTLSATRTSGCIYSASKNIAIYDGPVAKFTPSEQAGAAPLTVTFNNESNADSYFWQFDSGNSTSSEVSPIFTYTELGEYKVLLIASNIHGCIDTVSTKIYVVIPQVDLAMTNFSLVEDPSSNSSKPVVTILNLGNIQLTNPEVQIDLGGNVRLKEKIASTILPGKSTQQTLSLQIVPQSLGYICAEVAPAGDVNIYNDRQCLSLTNNDVLFYPYPNPAKGQINFDWISSENENVVVTIFKSTGQVAFQQNFLNVQSGINQLAIDISSLSSGLYLIQFSGAKAKKTFSVSVIN